jgi:hypothetical protein
MARSDVTRFTTLFAIGTIGVWAALLRIPNNGRALLSFANGKLVRSNRPVEGRTGTGSQGSPAHRRSFGSARQQHEAHGHGSEPEEDGGSAEGKVGEG